MSHETLRTFRWWCPSCKRSGTFDIHAGKFAGTFPQEVAPDAHALDVFMDEKKYCDGGQFEIAEIFNAGGACIREDQVGCVASSFDSPPAPLSP